MDVQPTNLQYLCDVIVSMWTKISNVSSTWLNVRGGKSNCVLLIKSPVRLEASNICEVIVKYYNWVQETFFFKWVLLFLPTYMRTTWRESMLMEWTHLFLKIWIFLQLSFLFFKKKKEKKKTRKKIFKKIEWWPKMASLSLHTHVKRKSLNAQKLEDQTVVWAAVKKSCVICGFNQTDTHLVQIFLLQNKPHDRNS